MRPPRSIPSIDSTHTINIMTTNWLNQLGDRNPQLLRELRARFQIRSVAVTIGISLIIQILIFIFFSSQLPTMADDSYCLEGVRSCRQTDWVSWWGDICKTLTYLIPYLLCIPGVFALVTDISQETQRGTLNFLRLSPRSSRNILLGKLLGVPVLGYFSLLLTLPLHLFSALVGGIPLAFLLSFYVALIAWTAVLFLAATFVGFSTRNNQASFAGNTQGLAMVVLSTIVILPAIQFWNSVSIWRWFRIKSVSLDNAQWLVKWFTMPINVGVILPHLFLLVNLAIIGYWLWRVLQRAFQKPTATLLSKRQSYAIVLYSAIFMLGFFITGNQGRQNGFAQIALLASSSIYATLTLIFALSTPRQMLFDWLRNRQEVALARRSEPHRPSDPVADLKEWIFGEKSPGITAIWINLLIIYGVISLLLAGTMKGLNHSLVGLFLTVTLVANYSLLVQLMLLMETTKRNVWAVGSLVFAIVVPSICAVLPGLNILMGYFTPGLWVMLASTNSRGNYESPIGLAIFALMIHVLILVCQVSLFRRRLHQMSRQVAPPI
jgi:hypothetical protein